MKREEIRIGQYVVGVANYDINVEGTVLRIHDMPNEGDTVVDVQEEGFVHGTIPVRLSSLFASREERTKEINRRNREAVESYKAGMKTCWDIIEFCLDNCVANGEEYTDWNARRAVEERMAELRK